MVLSAVTVSSAELVVRDAQTLLLAEPAGFSYHLDSPSYTGDGQDGFASAAAFEVGGRLSLTRPGDQIGLVLGLDASLHQASGGPGSLRSFLGLGSVGLGWAMTDRWVLLGEGRAGLGVSAIALNGTAYSPSFSASGQARAYQARVQASYFVSERWRVLASVGYGQVDSRYSSRGITLAIKQTGWSAGIGVSYAFSRDPVSLK
ncbi:hypothetical protein LBMAG53_04350 [Planctomycetota bacterium]|nr:hypothetical protein LBMAG53_04350 [Planctomycetota bacterium]